MHAQENPVGDPAVIMIDEPAVVRLREATAEALNKLKVEMKAQRLADSNGAIGWKTVKGNLVITSLVPF